MDGSRTLGRLGIWGFALGYFACYVPYSALTKAVSKGLVTDHAISGFRLLPATALVSMVGMFAFLTAMGWWRHASHRTIAGRSVPCPRLVTLLSGLCTSVIIATTTLAYTFSGVSIVFMMLIMRGGVLAIAPIVDRLTGRRVRWFSLIALLLSVCALVVAFSEQGGYALSVIAVVDMAAYVGAYFIRLQFMSRVAKSDDPSDTLRYFVEEQMVATPAVVSFLAVLALVGAGDIMMDIRAGFTEFWFTPVVFHGIAIGLFSQGTGIFGGLVLLSKQENSFCVPVNRSSSILAGVAASFALSWIWGAPMPSVHQLIGAALIIAAILFLSVPPMLQRRQARLQLEAA